MGSRWRVFVGWAVPLSGLWAMANWPRSGGSLKSFLHWAGFPWTFAFWDEGKLEAFNLLDLAADMGLGVVLIVGVAGLCSWSHQGVKRPPHLTGH